MKGTFNFIIQSFVLGIIHEFSRLVSRGNTVEKDSGANALTASSKKIEVMTASSKKIDVMTVANMSTAATSVKSDTQSNVVTQDTSSKPVQDQNATPPEKRSSVSDKAPERSTAPLWLLLAVFGFTTCVFAVMFVSEALKDTTAADVVLVHEGAIQEASNASSEESCYTPDCVILAAEMLNKMNLSANPCMDFNEYACGRYNKETPFLPGISNVDPIGDMAIKTSGIARDILQEPIKPFEPKYSSNMKRYFMSCTNEAQIEQRGLNDFLGMKELINLWPVLNPTWNETSIDLNQLLEFGEKNFVQPLFQLEVTEDLKNSSKWSIELGEPQLAMEREYFAQPRDSPVIKAYEKYLVETAVELGADTDVAVQDAKEVVDLEIVLSEIKMRREQQRDFNKLYNPIAMNELGKQISIIDVPRVLRAAFSTAKVDLADDEIIILKQPAYFNNLSPVLRNTQHRVLLNLFGFKFAERFIGKLTKRLREIKNDFLQTYMGSSPESRADVCLKVVAATFGKGLGRQFVEKHFADSTKASAKKMVENVIEEFRKALTDLDWMSQATKDEALKKLSNVGKKIGYPDSGFSESDLEALYKDFTMDQNNFYANRLLCKTLMSIASLKRLRLPVEKDSFHSWLSPTSVLLRKIVQGIHISTYVNRYRIPNGLRAINYGSIGTVIGHEITHGFDDTGSQFDENGGLRNWWQQKDQENFVKKKECIIDQFSQFNVSEIGQKIKGVNVQGEAVADTDGLTTAYRAFKQAVSQTAEEPKLPGLDLTQDQLFFLSYGQNWCNRISSELLMFMVSQTSYPPNRFRLTGTLQNSENFAKAYNCPQGSYMNPDTKCKVYY